VLQKVRVTCGHIQTFHVIEICQDFSMAACILSKCAVCDQVIVTFMAKMLVLFWPESLCMIVRLKSLVELKKHKDCL